MTSLVGAEEFASAAQNLEGVSTENLYAELIRHFDAAPNRDGLVDTFAASTQIVGVVPPPA